jgi:TetR/AcrR family transcriptional regulator, regulator of autoinduction and epiphytic fitness
MPRTARSRTSAPVAVPGSVATDEAPTPRRGGGAAVTDGRTARSQRTRSAIVEALVSLLEDGELQPTANRIAERAGISLRLIYHHFGDLDSLFRAVAERELERIATLTEPVDPSLPLPDRVEAMVRQRSAILEAITPVRRASLLQEPFSREIVAARRTLFVAGSREIERAFAAELAGVPPAERATHVDALQTVLSWGFWNDLRVNDRTEEQARVAVRLAVTGILAAAHRQPDG